MLRYLFLALLLCAAVVSSVSVSAAEEGAAPEVKQFGPDDIHTIIELDGSNAMVMSFAELGIVDLITVSYSYTSGEDNTTVEHVLVNAAPSIIPVEKTAIAKINIKDDPKYSKFITMTPNIIFSPVGAKFEKVQTVEAGTQRYYFLFVLRDGCDDCNAAGYARIAFDFDKDGNFIKVVLVKLMKTRQPL
ncbi:hypothetical protein [Candidatus Magnetominusculus xianensis]|uniref:Secreted protein n=1 Tax=Candidatus Magnetominusculus xianensis TaxID=1748249 RepID=A0ABR5SIX8_9BACT|nr:hypothetical protein [Candidatus Magnetominusculus xianensis]KWT92934.1 hypothetical protein ASN18_0369 [Candidatus Magnetominusculus xianensis]MBF0402938.1 hypothetical protein [Nitrospirota bacterium]